MIRQKNVNASQNGCERTAYTWTSPFYPIWHINDNDRDSVTKFGGVGEHYCEFRFDNYYRISRVYMLIGSWRPGALYYKSVDNKWTPIGTINPGSTLDCQVHFCTSQLRFESTIVDAPYDISVMEIEAYNDPTFEFRNLPAKRRLEALL